MILSLQPGFDHPSTILRKGQISKLLIMNIFRARIISQLLGPKILFIFLFRLYRVYTKEWCGKQVVTPTEHQL